MVLLAHRRSHDVLGIDLLYVLLLMVGVFGATLMPAPAVASICALGLAALTGGMLLSRTLQRIEPWSASALPGLLRDIAPLAAWSTCGAAIHWTFSQGYIYLVAGTLDVTAVAAIVATRLLMMPVNLLAAGLVATALCYLVLLLWGGIFLLIVMRDRLIYLPAAQGPFHTLTLLTMLSAIIALATSYWGILHFGLTGALLGILAGEVINVAGILMLCRRQGMRSTPHRPGRIWSR